jgi:hypothetical protein
MADLIALLILIYATFGLLFGVVFVSVGVGRVDPVARGAPLAFRLLILPGAAALWPVLAARWLRAGRTTRS